MIPWAFDTETHPDRTQPYAPEDGLFVGTRLDASNVLRRVIPASDPDCLDTLRLMLMIPEILLIGQKTCYDLAVIARSIPNSCR